MAATLKKVLVKRTIYTVIFNAAILKQYIVDCVSMGSTADLFKNPSITTAFFGLGTTAANNIQTAINNHELAPNETNLRIIQDKMALGVIWLNNYADQVEVIANADANRTTREEAASNIGLSFLSAQKLTATPKGAPDKPILIGENVGTGNIRIDIMNGVDYAPSQTNFVAVEVATGTPNVVVLTNGQLNIQTTEVAHVAFQSLEGKGKFTNFVGLKPGKDYHIYAYAQNGKKQISALSTAIVVKG